jgi:ATP-binding cassette subfamily F protein uup
MPLLSFDSVSITFGREALLDRASFQVDPGERVCLIGRNGAGKSTLLRIAEGSVTPDEGSVWRQPGLRIARSREALVSDTPPSDVVAGGLPRLGRARRVPPRLPRSGTTSLLRRMERSSTRSKCIDGWRLHERVDNVLATHGFADARWELRAAGAGASPSPARWWAHRTCCCSTSRPTIWTWR